VGHVSGVAHGRLLLADDLGANIAWADDRSAEFKRDIDELIEERGLDAPAPEVDPADVPHPNATAVHGPERLDFDAEGISSVIWTTGVQGEFGWLPPAAVGGDGRPVHVQGVSPVPGLFFLGLPWMRNRASGIIPGVGPDAAFIAEQITA
jgi:putative flavoprotein involved in K+ transport